MNSNFENCFLIRMLKSDIVEVLRTRRFRHIFKNITMFFCKNEQLYFYYFCSTYLKRVQTRLQTHVIKCKKINRLKFLYTIL